MHKTEEKVSRICELKDRILTCVSSAVDTAGIEDSGKLIDMVKDLCEAEKDLWKACYYHKMVEAMEEEKKEGGDDRYGYDNWRYSSGRYAPKGRGHRSGYTLEPPITWMDDGMPDQRMGMTRPESTYDRYRDSRRHYTETGKPADKEEMSHHAKMYVAEAMGTMRDIWKDADPEMKAKMKSDMAALSKEFGIG